MLAQWAEAEAALGRAIDLRPDHSRVWLQRGELYAGMGLWDLALDDYRRKVFFEGLAADYAALKADPKAWAEELAERQLWDATLLDGLDPEERWTEDGRCLNPAPPAEEST